MSKRSYLSASSRLRSKKESSAAQQRPTNKKSLSSLLSTADSQSSKSSGDLTVNIPDETLKLFRSYPKKNLESMVSKIEDLLLKTGHPGKIQFLTKLLLFFEAILMDRNWEQGDDR